MIPIVNTHSVFFPKINTHSGDCALSNSTVLGPGEVEKAGEGERRAKFEKKKKKLFSNLINLVHCWRPLKQLAAFVSAAVLSAANKLRRLAFCAFILRFDKIM